MVKEKKIDKKISIQVNKNSQESDFCGHIMVDFNIIRRFHSYRLFPRPPTSSILALLYYVMMITISLMTILIIFLRRVLKY